MTTTNEGELITKRMTANSLDNLYIECYLDNPSNKSAALRKAADLAGVKCDVTRQRAFELHARLQYQIDKGLMKRMIDGATLGYAVTYALAADESINPAIRLKASENLVIYAGKAKPDHTIKELRSRLEIKQEIENTKQRIELLTGETV